MNGRAIVSFLFGLIVVGIFVGLGVGIYQAGVAQGVVDAGASRPGQSSRSPGYGWLPRRLRLPRAALPDPVPVPDLRAHPRRVLARPGLGPGLGRARLPGKGYGAIRERNQ